jgi:hypothetical protein
MKIRAFIFLVLFLFWFSCSDSTSDPSEKYIVSGTLIYQEASLGGASVSIDAKLNLSTQTDENGFF